MSSYRLPSLPKQNAYAKEKHIDPFCSVCHEPVQLEKSNTDERGLAVHEECYLQKIAPQK